MSKRQNVIRDDAQLRMNGYLEPIFKEKWYLESRHQHRYIHDGLEPYHISVYILPGGVPFIFVSLSSQFSVHIMSFRGWRAIKRFLSDVKTPRELKDRIDAERAIRSALT